MTQDQTFQPMTDNPSAVASPAAFFGGIPWNAVNFGFINGNPANPTNNLNGKISTLLSNNVLTSQITPELSSKVTYRYYGFDNQTPRIIFPAWVSYDQTGSLPGHHNFKPVDQLHQAECRRRAELAAVSGMERECRCRLRAL